MRTLKLIFILQLLFINSSWAEDAKPQSDAKVSGEAVLNSQCVEHGIQETNGDPCIQTSLWFGFGNQFKLGFQGQNVSIVEKADTHVLLRLAAEIKIPLSGNSSFLSIQYKDNHYFKSNDLDGSLSALVIDIYGFKFLYEQNNNFEGTQTMTTHYALAKIFDILGSYKLDVELGYSMLEDTGYKNYADFKTGIGIKSGLALYEAAITATSSSEFAGRAKPQLILSAQVNF